MHLPKWNSDLPEKRDKAQPLYDVQLYHATVVGSALPRLLPHIAYRSHRYPQRVPIATSKRYRGFVVMLSSTGPKNCWLYFLLSPIMFGTSHFDLAYITELDAKLRRVWPWRFLKFASPTQFAVWHRCAKVGCRAFVSPIGHILHQDGLKQMGTSHTANGLGTLMIRP